MVNTIARAFAVVVVAAAVVWGFFSERRARRQLERDMAGQQRRMHQLTKQMTGARKEDWSTLAASHAALTQPEGTIANIDSLRQAHHEEGAESDAASTEDHATPDDTDLALQAERVDEEQALLQARRREDYQRVAQDMDARRLRDANDISSYDRVRQNLLNSNVPLSASASDDGCSPSICRFTLTFNGSAHDLVDQVEEAIQQSQTELNNWAFMRLPNDTVRLFTFTRDVPLRPAPSTAAEGAE